MSGLTDEELARLVAAATSESTPGESTELSSTQHFIISLGVKAGNSKVWTPLIYFTYEEWCRSLNAQPIGRTAFFIQFGKFFKRARDESDRWYELESAPFDLSQDTYFKVRKELREKRERIKAKKKKSSKVSWLGQRSKRKNKVGLDRP